jgi:tetratricopeptide (TPR) repeat protein
MSLLATPAADFDTLVLRNNETLKARVLAVEGQKVRLEVALDGGSAEVRRDLAEFTPASAFRIVTAASPPQTADDHLRLATFAASNDMPGAATRELETARKVAADDQLGAHLDARIEEASGVVMERMVRQRLAVNDPAGARQQLDQLIARHPDSEAAGRRSELMAEIRRVEERLEAERLNDLAMRAAEKRQVVLDTIRQRVDAGDVANRKGLLSAKNFGESRRQFLLAAGHYEAGLRAAEKLAAEDQRTETGMQAGMTGPQGARSLVLQTRANYADAMLNAASLYLVQSQHREAMALVNRVLATDPQNQDARSLRARIELAANQPLWMGGGTWQR